MKLKFGMWSFGGMLSLLIANCNACTRVSYTSGEEDGSRVIVGRTLDWNMPPGSTIYAFPAGMERNGSAGENSLMWTSKYGSTIITMYDMLTFDGMNTEGLHGGLLYLSGTDFGNRNTSLPGLSFSFWVQYFLDNYASVAEVKADLFTSTGEERFQIRTRETIPGTATVSHLILGDASGDNMVMEYLDGKLNFYQSTDYKVMTNEPPYNEQLAVQQYWQNMANTTLPGSASSSDRFARMSDYLRRAPPAKSMLEALATVQSLLRGISVTLRSDASSVSDSSTLWRVMADTKDKRYFYESVTEPVSFWINLTNLDLSPGAGVKRLTLGAGNTGLLGRHGEATDDFVNAEPYTPLLANSQTGDGFGGEGPIEMPGFGDTRAR